MFSGFQGIYDVDHFIKALRYDVRIVESIPELRKNGKTKKIKAYQVYYRNLVLLFTSKERTMHYFVDRILNVKLLVNSASPP